MPLTVFLLVDSFHGFSRVLISDGHSGDVREGVETGQTVSSSVGIVPLDPVVPTSLDVQSVDIQSGSFDESTLRHSEH